MNKAENNIVLTEFISGWQDLQYNRVTRQDEVGAIVKGLVDSAKQFNVPVYLLSNNDIDVDIENLTVVQTELFKYYPKLTLYFHRLEIAYQFLLAHPEIDHVFLTDAGDVKMLNYPFDDLEEGKIYFGDEPKLIKDINFFIDKPSLDVFKRFFIENRGLQLLNLGVIGGTRSMIMEFLTIAVNIIGESQIDYLHGELGSDLGNFEMELSNYVIYKYFADRVVHGRKVTTVFQFYEEDSHAWFKHK